MSVSIREVIEAAGYDLSTLEDAQWLLSVQSEFEQLVDQAERMVEVAEEEEMAEAEAKYQRWANS